MNAKDLKKEITRWLEIDPHLFDYDNPMPNFFIIKLLLSIKKYNF